MNLLEELKEKRKETAVRLQMSKVNRDRIKKCDEEMSELNQIIVNLQTDYGNLDKSLKFLRDYRVKQRNDDSNRITDAMNEAVKMVFPRENYRFVFRTKSRGAYSYTKLLYIKGNSDKLKIIKNCSGQGLQQTTSFTGVCSILGLSNRTPTLLLDECFASISDEEGERMSYILSTMASLGFQIITIEHKDCIYRNCDTLVYSLKKENGVTSIQERYMVNSGNINGGVENGEEGKD